MDRRVVIAMVSPFAASGMSGGGLVGRSMAISRRSKDRIALEPAAPEDGPSTLGMKIQRKIRLKDVAELAGVAVNTASTILNRRPNSWASKETEARVFKAANELGYRPSKTARALQSGRYHSIGLLIQDLTNPFFSTLADELEAAVEERGYDLIVENCRSSLVRERHLFNDLSDLEVDGMVVWLSDNSAFEEDLAASFKGPLPFVALGCGSSSLPIPVDSVVSNFTEGLQQAVDAMYELGHRQYAFLSALAEGQADGSRPDLMTRMLAEKGVPASSITILRSSHSIDSACETVTAFLKSAGKDRPTALFAINDLSAMGAMRAAIECGLSVPKDLSIVGVDDVPLASYLPITLSSIRQRYRKITRAAADLLIARIEGTVEDPTVPTQIIFPTHFVARESVGPAAH
jgi:LacI family transcriptional regulator